MVLRVILASSLLASTAAAAADRPARQPTAKWNVNFGEAQCVASRSYGTAENPLFLVIKGPPVGNVMQVAVMRGGGFMQAEQVDATIVTDQRPPRRTSMLTFGPKNAKLRAYVMNLPPSEFQEVREAKTLGVRSAGLDETFVLSQWEPLMKTLDRCVSDLRKLWNVKDPEGELSILPKRASANLAKLVRNEDYPAVAIRSDQSGVVTFAVLVDEKGKVSDCTVISTSGVPSLDAQTCALVTKRAKFDPALDAGGKPARDAITGRIRWVMAN